MQKDISRQAVINASRPYLILEVNDWTSDKWSHQSIYEPYFLFSFTNQGNAPAIIKERIFDITIARGVRDTIADEDFTAFSYEILLQGKTTQQFKAGISKKSIKPFLSDVKEHQTFVFAYGKFIYEGMSGITHETRFCWKYDVGSETFYEYGGGKYNRRL